MQHIRITNHILPDIRAGRMRSCALHTSSSDSKIRSANRAFFVICWAVVFFAVFGTHKVWTDATVGSSMRRQQEVIATFKNASELALEPDGHCRGKNAGGSCCGARFHGSFILPILPESELSWPRWFRGLLYRENISRSLAFIPEPVVRGCHLCPWCSLLEDNS